MPINICSKGCHKRSNPHAYAYDGYECRREVSGGRDVAPYLLGGFAVALAFVWIALRIHSYRIRQATDQQTTWDQRARGLPPTTYATIVALAAISILGVVVCVRGGAAAPLGVAVSVIAAVAAAGLRRQAFGTQYAADSVRGAGDE